MGNLNLCYLGIGEWMFAFLYQLDLATSDEALRGVFDDSDFELALLETGFRNPLTSLALSDRDLIKKTLKNYVFLRVKPEFDQFCEGLRTCGVAEAVQTHPSLMAPCFIHTHVNNTELNRGMVGGEKIVKGSLGH